MLARVSLVVVVALVGCAGRGAPGADAGAGDAEADGAVVQGGADGAAADGGVPSGGRDAAAPVDAALPRPDAAPPGPDAAPPDAGPCRGPLDCPAGRACELSSGQCTGVCSATQPCHDGCCNRFGFCESGRDDTGCGDSGGACLDCASAGTGTRCVSSAQGGHCGCYQSIPSDCPVGQACGADERCGTACDRSNLCNGGCCDLATGRCMTGTQDTACGVRYYRTVCEDCRASAAGPRCVTDGRDWTCGCTSATECASGPPAGANRPLCASNRYDATADCCRPPGAACTGVEDCCSNSCSAYRCDQ